MQLYANVFGEGQPFVILHGFLGMGDNWKTLGKKIAEQGFQVHLVDQRNHGRSFHDTTFDYEALAEDLKHYCEEHQLKNIILLGHSMGGKTAMVFASQYPDFKRQEDWDHYKKWNEHHTDFSLLFLHFIRITNID